MFRRKSRPNNDHDTTYRKEARNRFQLTNKLGSTAFQHLHDL